MARRKKTSDPLMEEIVLDQTEEAAEASIADAVKETETVSIEETATEKADAAEAAPESDAPAEEVAAPPKRKRGRPRKKPLVEETPEETPAEAAKAPAVLTEEELRAQEKSAEIAQAIADTEEYREDYLREQDLDIEDEEEELSTVVLAAETIETPESDREKDGAQSSEAETSSIRDTVNSYLASEVGLKNRNRVIWGGALIACLIIVIFVGIHYSGTSTPKETMAETTAASESATVIGTDEVIAVTTEELTACQDTELNTLMVGYYTAYAAGDTTQIAAIVKPLTDNFLATMAIRSEYIDSYPAINVYTKPGPAEGSYIAYVYTEVLLTGYSQNVPGLESYYVCTDENGNYYINMTEELADNVAQYFHDVDLQQDVIDLNNKVTSEFNSLLTEDATFAAYYAQMSAAISSSVAQTLAAAEVQAQETTAGSEETVESETETETGEAQESAPTIVKATDVVNMRASDSEQADKLGKAQIGETFTLVEALENGWSKVTTSAGETVYIKSDYLEVVSDGTEDDGEEEAQEENDTSTTTTTTDETQYVTATTTVNIRKSASETGEKLATVYQGTKLELVMKQADGWTKVKYDGQTAYVKSDYVE